VGICDVVAGAIQALAINIIKSSNQGMPNDFAAEWWQKKVEDYLEKH
jgi:hypothetical protein